MSSAPNPAAGMAPLLYLVPMAHVTDVRRSIEFYEWLGFTVTNTLESDDVTRWAWIKNGRAYLMITLGDNPLKPGDRDVLFYLYARDVVAYHDALAAKGVKVSEITHPPYMREGEFCITDPDGYQILVGEGSEGQL